MNENVSLMVCVSEYVREMLTYDEPLDRMEQNPAVIVIVPNFCEQEDK